MWGLQHKSSFEAAKPRSPEAGSLYRCVYRKTQGLIHCSAFPEFDMSGRQGQEEMLLFRLNSKRGCRQLAFGSDQKPNPAQIRSIRVSFCCWFCRCSRASSFGASRLRSCFSHSGIVKSNTRPVAAPPAPFAISPPVADCWPVPMKKAYSPGFRSELSESL